MKILKLKNFFVLTLILLIAGCSNISTNVENAQDNFENIEKEYGVVLEDTISNSDITSLRTKYLKFDKEVVEILKSETVENPLSLESRKQLKFLRDRVAHRLNLLLDLED